MVPATALLDLLALALMLYQHTLGPALSLFFDYAPTLHSFSQLLFNLLGKVLAEFLTIHLHPLPLNVHLGVPTKRLSHLDDNL